MAHVRTQLPYALTAAVIATFLGYPARRLRNLPVVVAWRGWIGLLASGSLPGPTRLRTKATTEPMTTLPIGVGQ